MKAMKEIQAKPHPKRNLKWFIV